MSDCLSGIADVLCLAALVGLVNYYTQQPALTLHWPQISKWLNQTSPLLILGSFFVVFASKSYFSYRSVRAQYHFVYGVASRLSGSLSRQYLQDNYLDFISIDSSVLHRRINQQPIEFAHYVLHGLQQLISQLVIVLITLAGLFIYNPAVFPLLALVLAPPAILVQWSARKKLRIAGMQTRKSSETAMQYLQETLHGYVESNLYGKNEFFSQRYLRAQQVLNNHLADKITMQAVPARSLEVIAMLGLLLLVALSTGPLHTGAINIVAIGALLAAAYKIIPGLSKILGSISQMKAYAFSTEHLPVKPIKAAEPVCASRVPFQSIEARGLAFSFPGKTVFGERSFLLRTGEMLVLQSVSGKGKTTLVNLLLGLLQPDAGVISVNGKSAGPQELRQWWPQVAYIKQQPFFLHASVAQNISLSDDRYDADRMDFAIRQSGLHKFLYNLPEGLQTVIAENGKNISGGQRQRLLLARALYKDASLIILDEPFSELDKAAEAELIRVLQSLAESGKMILLITHNPAAVNAAHKKMILDG